MKINTIWHNSAETAIASTSYDLRFKNNVSNDGDDGYLHCICDVCYILVWSRGNVQWNYFNRTGLENWNIIEDRKFEILPGISSNVSMSAL